MKKDSFKLAFFGLHTSFDYNHIGGTNSIIRRLSIELINQWDIQVDYILYGQTESNLNKQRTYLSGIKIKYFPTLREALEALNNYNHIVTIYLPPKDIFIYMQFRIKNKSSSSKYYMLHQTWSESVVMRKLMFAMNRLISHKSKSFAISPRLLRQIRSWDDSATLLWPPVPSNYFVDLPQKTFSDKIRVTFLGRIDVGKGVLETIDIFNNLADYPDVELAFYGMHWKNDPIAVKLHNQLLNQKHFTYVPVEFNNYSEDIDNMVRSVLQNTDIFIQPYRKLSSTIDTPLLILEAMASLCAVITKPYGDIPHIYGESPCLIDNPNLCEKAIELILSAKDWLPSERVRIDNQNKLLNFNVSSIAKHFVGSLNIQIEPRDNL